MFAGNLDRNFPGKGSWPSIWINIWYVMKNKHKKSNIFILSHPVWFENREVFFFFDLYNLANNIIFLMKWYILL
jgi:hypothetical protein